MKLDMWHVASPSIYTTKSFIDRNKLLCTGTCSYACSKYFKV